MLSRKNNTRTYEHYSIDGKVGFKLKTWIQLRCNKCGKFLGKAQKKYCKKCSKKVAHERDIERCSGNGREKYLEYKRNWRKERKLRGLPYE